MFPDAMTTGVPSNVTLKPSGSLTITTPGTVVEGLDINGSVTIAANNVTLKNCKISDASYDTVLIKEGVSGAVVQNCDIDNQGSGGQALAGQGTFLNNNIHGAADGIDVRGSNTTIKDNFIHDMQGTSGSHFDGIQADGHFSNVNIDHNTVINEHGQTSALMLSNYWGPINDTHIDNNLLVGGGYTVYLDEVAQGQKVGGKITDLSFTNNHLGTGYYGTMDLRTELGDHPTITGNTNDGATIAQSLHLTGQPSSDASGATASTGSSGSSTTTGSGTSATDGSGTAASGSSSTSTSHDPGTSTTDGSGTAASGSGSTSTSHDPGTSTTDGSGTAASGSGSTSTSHDPGSSTTDGSGTTASGGSSSTSHDPGSSTSGSGTQQQQHHHHHHHHHQASTSTSGHHSSTQSTDSSSGAADPTSGQTHGTSGSHDAFNFASHCWSHIAQTLQSSGSHQDLAQVKNAYDHFADALNHASQAGHDTTHAAIAGDTMTFKHGNTATQHHDVHLA